MKQAYSLYQRTFDSEQGVHWLEVRDGEIKKSWLAPREGGNHYYTSDVSNFVGLKMTSLRGQGFKKIRMTDYQYGNYLASDTLP